MKRVLTRFTLVLSIAGLMLSACASSPAPKPKPPACANLEASFQELASNVCKCANLPCVGQAVAGFARGPCGDAKPSKDQAPKIRVTRGQIAGCIARIKAKTKPGTCVNPVSEIKKRVAAICACKNMTCAKAGFGALSLFTAACRSFKPNPAQKAELQATIQKMERCVIALKQKSPAPK